MDKICGIYKITSPSGKIYIGKSKNIKRRISEYKRNNHISQPKIYNSILKYGWSSHNFEIIHLCDESELNNLERFYIKKYNTFNTVHGLNLTEGGDYTKMSNETKDKMKTIRNERKFWLGKKHTEDSRLKMSRSKMGNKNMVGHKHSEETKIKLSNSHKGKRITEITRQKIINGLTGRKCSEETRIKIGNANKNKRHFGRIVSENTRIKISDKNKKYAGNYEIYNQNNELVYKFKSNVKKELKKIGLPVNSFCDTYKNNQKIRRGKYVGWYIIKL